MELMRGRQTGGALPQSAVGTLADVDFAAEDGCCSDRHLLYMQNVETV